MKKEPEHNHPYPPCPACSYNYIAEDEAARAKIRELEAELADRDDTSVRLADYAAMKARAEKAEKELAEEKEIALSNFIRAQKAKARIAELSRDRDSWKALTEWWRKHAGGEAREREAE